MDVFLTLIALSYGLVDLSPFHICILVLFYALMLCVLIHFFLNREARSYYKPSLAGAFVMVVMQYLLIEDVRVFWVTAAVWIKMALPILQIAGNAVLIASGYYYMHQLGREGLELRRASQKNPASSYIFIPIVYAVIMRLIMWLSVLCYADGYDLSSVLSPSSWETYDILVWDVMAGVYYEFIYRLVFLGLVGYALSRVKYGFESAILLVAALEALLQYAEHLPQGIIFTYVFMTGITLGFLFKRFGILVPMLCSALFNLSPI